MRAIQTVVLLLVCLGSLLCAGTSTPQGNSTHELVTGISVTREEVAPHHVRVAICGPDVTRLPHGFPLVFQWRVPVRGIVVRNGDAGLRIGARVDGHTAVVTLTRDPFIAPMPWRVVVLLSVEGSLREGQLVVGTAHYRLPTPLPSGRATVVLGTGCEERHAGDPAGGLWGTPQTPCVRA